MIARYEVPAVSKLWSDDARFRYMLQVEIALLETLENARKVPRGTANAFRNVKIKTARILEIEKTTRHDVIAFCTSITEQVDPKYARFFHYGVTSSDVIDTAVTLQLRDSLLLVVQSLEKLIASIQQKVRKTQNILALGRSHGMAAEPIVFAQKFLSSQVEFQRRLKDYQETLKNELTGQISGAVGNYTLLTPEIEEKTLKRLGLPAEPVSTQVIPRDHIAKIISAGALTAAAIERLSVEIRHLHRSDVGEVAEGFKPGQKGSSTMPHKKNPIATENLSGISRVLRSHVEIALQNVVLWHERDISHSSTERMMLPDHFGLLCYSLNRLAETLRDLEVNKEVIEKRTQENFKTLSSLILHTLIEQNSVTRETLYALVQKAAFQSKSFDDFISSIKGLAQKDGLKADLSEVKWKSIQRMYFDRFQTILARSESSK